jgi:hypothetical protein
LVKREMSSVMMFLLKSAIGEAAASAGKGRFTLAATSQWSEYPAPKTYSDGYALSGAAAVRSRRLRTPGGMFIGALPRAGETTMYGRER